MLQLGLKHKINRIIKKHDKQDTIKLTYYKKKYYLFNNVSNIDCAFSSNDTENNYNFRDVDFNRSTKEPLEMELFIENFIKGEV